MKLIEGCNERVILNNVTGFYTNLDEIALNSCKLLKKYSLQFNNSTLHTLYSRKSAGISSRNSTIGYLNAHTVGNLSFTNTEIENIEELHSYLGNAYFNLTTVHRIKDLKLFVPTKISNSKIKNVSPTSRLIYL